MSINIEITHEYLKQWVDDNELNDFNMAYDSGFTDYCCHILVSAGAIEPIDDISKQILKNMKDYNPKKDVEECFNSALVVENLLTNEILYLKNKYVDYLIDLNEFKNESQYRIHWPKCSMGPHGKEKCPDIAENE